MGCRKYFIWTNWPYRSFPYVSTNPKYPSTSFAVTPLNTMTLSLISMRSLYRHTPTFAERTIQRKLSAHYDARWTCTLKYRLLQYAPSVYSYMCWAHAKTKAERTLVAYAIENCFLSEGFCTTTNCCRFRWLAISLQLCLWNKASWVFDVYWIKRFCTATVFNDDSFSTLPHGPAPSRGFVNAIF